jgi:hypothetical protein
MKFIRAVLRMVLGLAAVTAAAAPLTRDLGDGLLYVRVRELPADLPASPPVPGGACVLDLRYLPAGRDAAAAFVAWAEFRAGVRSPLFLLANRDTGAELRAALRRLPRGGGCIVIGIPGPGFEPQLAVPSDPAAERTAYDALEGAASALDLLVENPGKPRLDEASLNRPRPEEEDLPSAASPASRPVDAALQRALHLHRSLRALRRL